MGDRFALKMAGAAAKKQAVSNNKILKGLHTCSLAVNVFSILVILIFNRPNVSKLKYYLMFNGPLITSEYMIEKYGRPKYKEGVVLNEGIDLKQEGLTEYMFDVVYLTLFCDVLMCVFGSLKVFYILLLVPAFAGYKIFGLLGYGRSLLKQRVPSDNDQPTNEPSKRLAKMAARQQKGRGRAQRVRM